MSPKAMGVMREGQATKLKYGLKGSPKQQNSPTARLGPSGSAQGALFAETGRNIQTSIRTKNSMGTTSNSSGTMNNNYMRSSGNGLSHTAQYKKVLMKGPMPLMAGKVLDDNDDEEDEYDDDDLDE